MDMGHEGKKILIPLRPQKAQTKKIYLLRNKMKIRKQTRMNPEVY